jgi:hypothetical protein
MTSAMHHLRRALVNSSAVLMVGFLVRALVAPGVVFAATAINCQEGPAAVNHWRGEGGDLATAAGASGTVPAATLALCNPGLVEVDGAFYFSNVTPTNGGFNDIVQVGFGANRCPACASGTRYVTGYGRTHTTPGCGSLGDKSPTADNTGAYVAAQHDFKVYHTANQWRFYVDNTLIRSIGEASICWTPKSVSWFGETWDSGDQMGGTAASKMSVNSMNYATAEGGQFFLTTFNPNLACNYAPNQPPAAYQCDITAATSLKIWTNNR